MIKYTKKYVNIISIIATIIIFLIINQIKFPNINKISISKMLKKNLVVVELTSSINQNFKLKEKSPSINTNEIEIKTKNTEEKIEKVENTKEQNIKKQSTKEINAKEDWKIIIPKISLEAEISEGTRKEVMNKFVGHFEETATKGGNIGLAAHNRGYPVNYFANIKKLKEGDEIIYRYNDFEKTYLVSKNKIIKDTDWEPLKNNTQNTITLITCVENEPAYRRCVQGIENTQK